MLKRGARRFVFLSRSGAKSKDALALVSDLETQGARVKVALGDVCKFSDVQDAVQGIEAPLGGIIHAAMVLDVRQTHDPILQDLLTNSNRSLCSPTCPTNNGTMLYSPRLAVL